MGRKRTPPDDRLLPLLLNVATGHPDQLTPNQLFTLVDRGWIMFGVSPEMRGGIMLSATVTRLGHREAALYAKRLAPPPQGRDE